MSDKRKTENPELNSGTGTGGDQIAVYLEDLRQRMARGMVRTSRDHASQILAEAEDHLREAAAASVAAGMSEQTAQTAAIDAFGQVRTVARSHRPRADAVIGRLIEAVVPLLGAYLLVAAATGTVFEQLINNLIESAQSLSGGASLGSPGTSQATAPSTQQLTQAPVASFQLDPWLVGCAVAGLVMLASYIVVRRLSRSHADSARKVQLPGFFFPLAAAAMLLLAVVEFVGIVHLYRVANFVGDYNVGAGGVLGAGVTALACAAWSVILFARWAATTLRASIRTRQLTTN